MSYANIRLEAEGHLTTIFVNRPEKLNALDHETISELSEAVEKVSEDSNVGAVILTGAGEKAFVAGADIGMLAEQGAIDGRQNSAHGQRLTQRIEDSPKPFLAAINGYALGGGLELALACDLRYASSRARLGLPEVSLGIIPGYGGTIRLPRLVGTGCALELILTGDPITAEQAQRIGLVNAVFEPEQLLEKVKAVAIKIIARGPTALAFAKQSVQRGADLSQAAGLALEADLFGLISSTDEMKEGTKAFLEKRAPSWQR